MLMHLNSLIAAPTARRQKDRQADRQTDLSFLPPKGIHTFTQMILNYISNRYGSLTPFCWRLKDIKDGTKLPKYL